MAKRDFNKVNKINFNGTSPFFEAIEKKNVALVEEMIENGADVHGRTTGRNFFSMLMVEIPYAERSTPLHVACLLGSPEITNLLLAHDADPNARNDEGMTPLDYALSSHAYYQSDWEKKKTGRSASATSVAKAEEKVKIFEGIIQDVLARGGQPALFALPNKFSNQDIQPPRARPLLP